MLDTNRILIVEDHTLLRQGLQAMLAAESGLVVVGEAEEGRKAIQMAHNLSPDLILMDLSMPGMNGTEVIAEIKHRHSEIKILVLTVHNAEEYIREALRAGADGYMLKHATREELIQAILNVMNGRTHLCPDVAEKVVCGYLGGGSSLSVRSPMDSLTLREREVLKLIAEGKSNKDIADYLCVSVKTVEKHRSNLMRKLDLHNASTLTAFAIERGLLATL